MADIARTKQKIFGSSATSTQVTSFGSIKAGTPVYTKDPATIMNSAFEGGWDEAVQSDYAPYRQDFTAIELANTSQLAYLFQKGIAEWEATTDYYANKSFVNYGGTIYKCIQNSTGNQPNISTNYWQPLIVIPEQVKTGSLIPYAGSSTLSGTLFCDGSAVSRTTYANLFSVIGTRYGSGNGSTTFNLPNLIGRSPWMLSTTNNGSNGVGSLPNITGGYYIIWDEGGGAVIRDYTGAFYSTRSSAVDAVFDVTGSAQGRNIWFDASRVSNIYQSVSKVTPSYLECLWLIKY